MAIGAGFGVAIFRYFDGRISFDRHSVIFISLALATIPLLYKLLWTFADGEYSPVVAEKSRLFLIGAYLVYGMVPR